MIHTGCSVKGQIEAHRSSTIAVAPPMAIKGDIALPCVGATGPVQKNRIGQEEKPPARPARLRDRVVLDLSRLKREV
jgi:hypothetical protein